MGKKSRDKGQRGEREVAEILRPYFPNICRGFQFRGGVDGFCDLERTPYWIESKYHAKGPSIRAAWKQAVADTDDSGDMREILVWTRGDHETWKVTMEATTFTHLLDMMEAGRKFLK